MKLQSLLSSILMQHTARTRPRWYGAGAALVGVAWCYAALNVLLICTTPMLNTVMITLDVVDDASSAPIAGAAVRCASIHGRPDEDRLGDTNRHGVVTFRRTIQQNGWWVWPRIGTLDLRGWVLHVQAPGFRVATVELGQALPALPLGEAEGQLRVRLRRA